MKESLLDTQTRFDWLFFGVLMLLVGIGIAMVYSATANAPVPWYGTYWFKQILHFVAGFVLAILIAFCTTPKMWRNLALPLYLVTLVLLVFVAFGGGYTTKGAGRWISLGGFRLQPSEFAKIAYLLMLAAWLSRHKVNIEKLRSFVVPGILFLVPFGLVLKQPNLSTALVFSAITLAMFYWAGLKAVDILLLVSPVVSVIFSAVSWPLWTILAIAVFFVAVKRKLSIPLIALITVLFIGGGLASSVAWNSMEDHQRSRIRTFVDPMRDPKGEGYQVIQSQVAMGSGGLFGKGFGEGSQTNLSFLPEEHTDFIFSVLGEQFGFVGCAVVLFLLFLLLMRGISICRIYDDSFVNLVVVGACTILFFHALVNVAMTVGLMPVTGLPLPFISYGGSFVLTCMALVGLLFNMRLRGDRV
jgi:rod shape determining protein RodA